MVREHVISTGSEVSGSSQKASPRPMVPQKHSAHSPASQKHLLPQKTSRASIKPPSHNEKAKKTHRKVIKPFPSQPIPKGAPSSSNSLVDRPSSSSKPPPSLTNSISPSLPAPTGSSDSADSAMKPAGGGVSGESSSVSTPVRPLTFPPNVSGSECSPSTGSEVRDRCRELIVRALKKGHNEGTNGSLCV